ncbi:phospholipid-transporting ATPase ABCA1-like isoform X2 [Belonocnema kinseyi]|uniref:phospholipid-transporting ATPase ABCA1-like isoform X2 n=1 Tax=Belonocnema kinseyi TaxID=2817044 RepID=UPI00143D74DE|nr:phospholipid-transporting ATPase ABCA1-like isoform X2 [Belonocnema kinseyi]
MANGWRIFTLLMWKNYTVRRRHWKLSLLVEICIPIILFVFSQVIRDFSVILPPSEVRKIISDTHYPVQTKEEILRIYNHFPVILYFLPRNNFTENLMKKTGSCLLLPEERIKGFYSEDELMNAYASRKHESYSIEVIAVLFKNPERLNSSLKHLEYVIRTEKNHSDNGIEYFLENSPFVQTQICIDESFLKMKMPNRSIKTQISMQRMPYPAHLEERFNSDEITKAMYPVVAILAFLIPLCIETIYPSNEKSLGLNILMSMSGVKNYQNLLSWLISGLFFSILYIVPRIALLKITFSSENEPYLNFGDVYLVATMHFVHIVHLLAFGFHITVYFSRSIFRSFGSPFLYTGSFILQKYMVQLKNYTVVPYLGIFFPNILLYRIYEEIDIKEETGIGVGWHNLFLEGDINYKSVGSLGAILIFSIFGILIHFLLALYASALFPGKYGVPKHPLYFLRFWKSKYDFSEEELYVCCCNDMEEKPFEPIAKDDFTPAIQTRNLRKSYSTNFLKCGKQHALCGISIDFYKGEITTLLGHNGAGKTTMMSILTGLLSPTKGMVLINGKNISDEMDTIVTDLGICPQEDILFPDLNIFEQIEFFALLKNKNKTRAQVKKEVKDLIKQLKLTDKKDVLPSNLSESQKRKVCLAMAIIGDASTLILDEPTTGMDPESRRVAWDILLKMRGEKTILISTHNMDEADVLGDRTAIIHLGKLKSYGTPMFLKKFYGQGNIEVTLSTADVCNLEKIKNQLKGKSHLINLDGTRIVFSIPYSDPLADDLDKIEERKKELGVNDISVSLINLEQVFLRATTEENEKSEVYPMEQITKVKGVQLSLQSAMALFQNKCAFMQNNMFFSLMFLLPLVSVLLIALSFCNFEDTSEYPMRLKMYRDPEVLYSSNNEHYRQLHKAIVESFNGKGTNVGIANISEAILDFGRKDLTAYRNNLLAAASFEVGKLQEIKANAFYSQTLFYSIPISLNLVSNTIIKALVGKDYQIYLSSQMLPPIYQFFQFSTTEALNYFRVILLIVFIFPTFALYVIQPIREASYGIKQLQRMTGVSSFLYWGTFFLFDFLIFIVSMILMLIGFYCMDIALDLRLFYGTEMSIMLVLLTLFALNTLPFVYIFSFLERKTSTAITILAILPLVVVVIESVIRWAIHFTLRDQLRLSEILRVVEKRVFMLMPFVSFFYGQVSFFTTAEKNAKCRRMPTYFLELDCKNLKACCASHCTNGKCEKSLEYFGNFKEDGNLEESLLFLCLTPLFYFTILAILEHKIIPRFLSKYQNKNPDVNQEMEELVKNEKISIASQISELKKQADATKMQNDGHSAVNTVLDDNSIFLIYELSKYYGNFSGVKEISFSIKKSECFGLLGVNGAGKSTTFRMLTGEEFANSGVMYLNGKEITVNRKEFLSQIGYCPQNSALIKSLNARDHLKLFACLRGVPKSQVSSEVEKWINRLKLNLCASQRSGTYSGGTQRRLSIAIALIGNPNLVLLDEPTTGVDPVARKSLWNVIKSCQLAGQSIIFTSHSMEECEALCNRLAIMVKGELVCIGPSQQLKKRYGAGYEINLKLNPKRSNADVENIKKDMHEALECQLRDEHVDFLSYHVINAKTKWKTMYGVMKHLKENYICIEDFSIFSATLEQLFLKFARLN